MSLFDVELNTAMVVVPDDVAPTIFASDTLVDKKIERIQDRVVAWVLRTWEGKR